MKRTTVEAMQRILDAMDAGEAPDPKDVRYVRRGLQRELIISDRRRNTSKSNLRQS